MKIIVKDKERNKIIWEKDIDIPEDHKVAFFSFLELQIGRFKKISEIVEGAKKEMTEGWKWVKRLLTK